MRELLCKSLNDKNVFLNVDETNIGLHIIGNPNLIDLVKEVVLSSDLKGKNIGIEKDLGRIVGQTSCVTTTESDEIVYAKRLYRDSFSRFVKNRALEDTSFVSVVLFEKEYGYLIWSAWCGRLVPTSPDSTGRMKTSEGFWSNHALVYDESLIQPETVTKIKPTY